MRRRKIGAIAHVTYGKSELYVRALLGAGFKHSEIVAVCTQIEELAPLRALLPDQQILTPAARPPTALTPWTGLAPTGTLRAFAARADLDYVDLILGDRHLRRRPIDQSLAWVNSVAEIYQRLISTHLPEIVIGETANASEILLWAAASEHGCSFVQPAPLRIPGGRFGLWLGPRSEQLLARPRPAESCEAADRELTRWYGMRDKPFDYANNSTPPSVSPLALGRATGRAALRTRPAGSFQMQRPVARDYVELPWMNRWSKYRYSRATTNLQWKPVTESPYIFYPLHVQPEASIDWYPRWRNQLAAAKLLARELSEINMRLVVKDHANFLWNRGESFHRELLGSAEFDAVNPSLDSRALVKGAVATVTVSGTVGLEAGLVGASVLCVADQPWQYLPTVAMIDSPSDISRALTLEREPAHQDNIRSWFRQYFSHSWPGLIADVHQYPEVLNEDNVNTLSSAIAEVLDSDNGLVPWAGN